jgi:hypothetical protein
MSNIAPDRTPGLSPKAAQRTLKWVGIGLLVLAVIFFLLGTATRGPNSTNDFLGFSSSLFWVGSASWLLWLVTVALKQDR